MTTTDTTTLPVASYARLPDDTWGMRVPGFAAEGTRVLMRKKDGSEHEATVGEVVRRFSGRNPAVLARITHSGERRVSVPKLAPLPRCTLCREQFTAARPRSTRDDSPGRCSVCSPAWPTCRGCEKVMYGCRPEPWRATETARTEWLDFCRTDEGKLAVSTYKAQTGHHPARHPS